VRESNSIASRRWQKKPATLIAKFRVKEQFEAGDDAVQVSVVSLMKNSHTIEIRRLLLSRSGYPSILTQARLSAQNASHKAIVFTELERDTFLIRRVTLKTHAQMFSPHRNT
jgi:hypothetical protein